MKLNCNRSYFGRLPKASLVRDFSICYLLFLLINSLPIMDINLYISEKFISRLNFSVCDCHWLVTNIDNGGRAPTTLCGGGGRDHVSFSPPIFHGLFTLTSWKLGCNSSLVLIKFGQQPLFMIITNTRIHRGN